MKKGLIAIVIIVALVVGGILFFSQGGAQAFGSKPNEVKGTAVSAANIPPVVVSNEINVAGHLVPAQNMSLSFTTNGEVQEILVKEGDQVEKGQVVARLSDVRQLKLSLSQAQLDLLNAQKTLSDLTKNAPMLAAQTYQDLVLEKKELKKAQDKRASMNYAKAKKTDIDSAYKDWKYADDLAKQVEEYANSESRDAHNAYVEATKQRDILWNKYTYLISKYTDQEVAEADAAVQVHTQKLKELQDQYDTYSKGPDPMDVAIAQARIQVAKDQLDATQAKYSELEIRAPFSGSVVTLNAKPGEVVTPGQAVVLLADFSRWHIETEDLTELGVTRISEGAAATIKFDALPDKTFDGKVLSIKNYGETKRGDITYTAIIEISNTDPRLRWNMTSPISIRTK